MTSAETHPVRQKSKLARDISVMEKMTRQTHQYCPSRTCQTLSPTFLTRMRKMADSPGMISSCQNIWHWCFLPYMQLILFHAHKILRNKSLKAYITGLKK